jgi:integrase/recombinase XerD
MEIVNTTNKFIQWMRVRNMAGSTIDNYAAQVRMFLTYFKDVPRPVEVSAEQIMDYLLTKIKPNTQRHAHSALKLFFCNIVGQPLKFKHIPYAKKEQKLPQPLEMDEMLRMVQACGNKKHMVILYLLYGCGLRCQELIDLKWKHIDRAAKVIYVVQGKGKKDRKVQLYPDLVRVLTEYYTQYKQELKDSEYVLKGQCMPQYSQRSVNEVLKQLAAKAGIKRNVHAHLLRHGYASHMLDAGVDLRTIQELLGHSSSKTTEIYTHVSKKHIASTVSPMQLALQTHSSVL